MDILKIAMIGLGAVLLAIQMKHGRGEYEMLIILVAGLCISFFMVGRLEIVIGAIEKIQSYIKIDARYLGILMKMIGITYVAEFSSNLCKDAGYRTVAGQIEMFAKLSVFLVSMPVLLSLIETISVFLG